MTLIFSAVEIEHIANTCAGTPVDENHSLLLQKMSRIYPKLSFKHVLTRAGWYRSGGVISSSGERVCSNLREWIKNEFSDDLDQLIEQHLNSGYIVTSMLGKTHYFVAQTGNAADEFVQLEVEELLEVKERELFYEESLPLDIEDVIEPAELEKLETTAVGMPFYVFRRITPVASFISLMSERMTDRSSQITSVQRFMHDWDRSSSKEDEPFCHHWVFSMREYTDAYGEPVMQAKPVSTFTGSSLFEGFNDSLHGSKLASLVHSFDHRIGYPMAWYFFMLSHPEVPHKIAESINKDLIGAYDYLAAKDLKILKDWSNDPYGI